MKRIVFKNVSTLLITVSLLVAPFTLKAQLKEYTYNYSVVVGTSDSRMFLTVHEEDDRVEFQVSSIGKINARAFLTAMVYDTSNLILTDKTYLYDIPEFEQKSQSTSPVISMPESFMNRFPNFVTGVSMHLPVPGGDGLGMNLITTSIGLNDITSLSVSLAPGEMVHTYSIHFRKATPEKPLLPSDFGFFAQAPLAPMKPLASTMWTYFAMSIRNCTGQPGEWIVLKPEFFSFRSPSYVTTDAANQVNPENVTLHATFTRGDMTPTNIIKSGYFEAKYDVQLNWDAITQYGFIYSDVDATILVNGLTTQLNIDGTDYDFPDAAEVAAGKFTRDGKTFYISQIVENNSSDQTVPYSQTITDLMPGATYYAWSFIHYTYETSYPHLNVGNKISFETTSLIDCIALNDKTVYADSQESGTYTHSGTDWEPAIIPGVTLSSLTYNLSGATTGTGATTLNGVQFNLCTTTVTWIAIDDSGKVDSCSFTVEVIPVMMPQENLIYCHGEAVPEYTFAGAGNTNFYWKRVAGYDFGLDATEGINSIPAFTAQNYGFEYVSALYQVTPKGAQGCAGETKQFLITVNPKPVTSPVGDMVYCNGVTAPRFDFSSDMPDVYFAWEFVNEAGSVMIPGIPASGENFIPSFMTYNTSNEPLVGKYRVRASYSYDNHTCYDDVWQYFNITVLPTPTVTVTPENQTINSGETISDIVFSGNVTEALYQWTRVAGNIPEIPSSGTGNITGMTIFNHGTLPISATYIAVAALNYGDYPGYTCIGNRAQFTITVNPTAFSDSVPNFAYCNGELAPAYTFTGSNPLATYTWEFISGADFGLPTNGNNTFPSFVAMNTGNDPLIAYYRVRSSYGTFVSEWIPFSVTVNPTPSVDLNITPYQFCAGEETPVINLPELFASLNNNAETVYEWYYVSGDYIGLDQESGTNTIPSFTAINNSNQLITSSFKVRAKFGTCISDERIFKIVVNPQPSVMGTVHAGTICSETLFEYTIIPNMAVDKISWIRMPHPDINNNESASGNNNYIGEILNNTGDSDVTVTYLISLITGKCSYENIGEVAIVVTPDIKFNMNPVTTVCNNKSSIILEYEINILGAHYTLIFGQEGNAAGFGSVQDYVPLPDHGITLNMPQGVKSGNYPAKITLKYGKCTKTYDIIIVVNGTPVATDMSGFELAFCDNDDMYLFVTIEGNVQYQWYFNGNILTGETESYYKTIFDITKEGEYFVEVSNECGTVTYFFSVTQNPAMIKMKWDDVMYVANSNNLYVGYQWYKDGQPIAQNGQDQYYSETGGFTPGATYYVKAFKADGTYDEACPIIPDTQAKPAGSSLTIYPNPTQNGNEITFLLTLPEGKWADADAFIYDITGKRITQFRITSAATQVTLNVAAGAYMVKVITATGNEFNEKLIILK